jgi:nucleotide-binding universal stress UspA family protein
LISTILVGVDGSENSGRALDWTLELARAVGANVVAIHALGLLEPGEPPVPVQSNLPEIERRFAEWCESATRAGVSFRRELCYGTAAQSILEAIPREKADLIVVGTRGSARPASFSVLGSTSHQVANLSKVPVVIVPPAT